MASNKAFNKDDDETRRDKYNTARAHGYNPKISRRLRDFRPKCFWGYVKNNTIIQ